MKETPQEIKIHNNLKAGVISIDGFLGDDSRHYHEIIVEDRNELLKINTTTEELADRMNYFAEISFEHYEGSVLINDYYEVEYKSYRGKILCPFSHPGLFRKGEIFLYNKKNDIRICWTPLNIHMLREHCFLEGKGSKHRLEPINLYRSLFE